MTVFDGYLAVSESEAAGAETPPDEQVLALRAHIRTVLRSLVTATLPAC
jgi:hypothetical protein